MKTRNRIIIFLIIIFLLFSVSSINTIYATSLDDALHDVAGQTNRVVTGGQNMSSAQTVYVRTTRSNKSR